MSAFKLPATRANVRNSLRRAWVIFTGPQTQHEPQARPDPPEENKLMSSYELAHFADPESADVPEEDEDDDEDGMTGHGIDEENPFVSDVTDVADELNDASSCHCPNCYRTTSRTISNLGKDFVFSCFVAMACGKVFPSKLVDAHFENQRVCEFLNQIGKLPMRTHQKQFDEIAKHINAYDVKFHKNLLVWLESRSA